MNKKEETKDKDFDEDIYKKALQRGESEKSARARATKVKPKHQEEEIIDRKKITWGAYKDEIPEDKLIVKSDYMCPSCLGRLYNTNYDDVFYYCPKCKMQHNKKWIAKFT